MATLNGQLGAADVPGTGTLTSIYKVPSSRKASINLTIANRSDIDTNIRIAHIKGGNVGDIANEDYLMYDVSTGDFTSNVAPVQITGIAMGEGDTIAVYSSTSAVSAQANGIEEDV